ncbi:hypothetical protein BaRGS_00018873 [Batillaria attramentaria]|uniref:Aminopeptidase P N-terminal domain-containing protein n=1 Tax=Batillaria attramentaria TaxID=370345 RepID=A0ABD0KRC7_9CAEN
MTSVRNLARIVSDHSVGRLHKCCVVRPVISSTLSASHASSFSRGPAHMWSTVRRFGQPAAQTHPHLLSSGEVTPGITKEEYRGRRSMLVSLALKSTKGVNAVKDHIFVFPSASKVYMTNDIPYPFRQNTDFLYLSGFQEPDSVLVIQSCSPDESSGNDHKSFLFVPKKDPAKELWEGPRSGVEGAITLTGVDDAFNFDQLEKFLEQWCKDYNQFMLWYDYVQPVQSYFHTHVMSQVICQERHKAIENTTRLMHHLRVKKSPAEVELMRQSIEIASESLVEVMKFSRPQVNEAHLWAKMDFECRIRGAQFLAYPPVVAGGARANTIHYIANNQVVADGDLVLMDAGCELHGYTSDLTRTWPVSGRFSPAQRELYEATLAVQKACIALCTLSHSLDDVYRQMLVLLGMELQKLGIIPHEASVSDVIKRSRYPVSSPCWPLSGHGPSTILCDFSRSNKLQPGMVVTVEPGIYIREDDTSVDQKYRGIGIRIEDNILITESAPVNLSQKCPKTVEEIERILSGQ